jgi:hypothetical protein
MIRQEEPCAEEPPPPAADQGHYWDARLLRFCVTQPEPSELEDLCAKDPLPSAADHVYYVELEGPKYCSSPGVAWDWEECLVGLGTDCTMSAE